MCIFLNSLVCFILIIAANEHSCQVTTDSQVGYILIDRNPLVQVILAEPHTLPSNKEINIRVYSTITPLNFEISFIWTIHPHNRQRLEATEGFGAILRDTNQTIVTIQSKDSAGPIWEDTIYMFSIDRVLLTNSSQTVTNVTVFIDTKARSFPFRFLPSNYPFGLIELGPSVLNNLTISLYSRSSLIDSVQILRRYGRENRILITYEEIEFFVRQDKVQSNKTVKYLEFLDNEFEKFINLSHLYKKTDLTNYNIKYPR
jgi:hypothetical protein